MTIEGVDFSYARPGGAALVASGKHFVVRYLSGDGRGLTAAEVKDYHAHGLTIALVYEVAANRALQGQNAGRIDATTAAAIAKSLGFPATQPIYFAVDFDATAAQFAAIDAYLRGAASVITLALTGVYGGIRVIDHCAVAQTASWFWQTYAWSGGALSANAHLFQYRNGQVINGGAVDLCRAIKGNFGQWPAPVAPSPTSGTPPPVPTGHTLHIAHNALVTAYQVTGRPDGCLVLPAAHHEPWTGNASKVPCGAKAHLPACNGQPGATVVAVTAKGSPFAGLYVNVDSPGVTVTSP